MFFKKKAKPEFNCQHPDNAHLIERAFKAGGKVYYRFKEEKLIPAGRYKYVYMHLMEADLRMNRERLLSYISDFEGLLNGSGPKKTIEIGKLWELIINLKSRVKLAFEPETIERLSAVIYFDDTEDLSTYDRKYGQKKIEYWKKNNVLDFFLTRPIGELFGLSHISVNSLEESITIASQILQDLTTAQQKLSSENSSGNGSPPSSS